MNRIDLSIESQSIPFVKALKQLSDDDFRYIAHTTMNVTRHGQGLVCKEIEFNNNQVQLFIGPYTITITATLSITVRSTQHTVIPLNHGNQVGVFTLFMTRGIFDPKDYTGFAYV